MKSKTRFQVLLITFLGVLMFSACSGSKEPATIKVVFLPYLSNAPFFIAQEEGFFAEQGLTIELVEMARSSESIPALEQGDVDVVGGAISAGLLNAIYRGANIKVVADKGLVPSSGCPGTAFLASNSFLEAHPSKDPAELKGARIGFNPAGFTGYWLSLHLKQGNLTLNDIENFKGTAVDQFQAIQEGTLDLMGASEPWATRVLQDGYGEIWVADTDVIPGSSYAMVWYGPNLLLEYPELGNRFMVAYMKGVQQFNLGKTDRNVEILVKYTELDENLVRNSCWINIDSKGEIDISRMFEFQNWALEQGLVDGVITEEQFWDPSFIEYAVNILQ